MRYKKTIGKEKPANATLSKRELAIMLSDSPALAEAFGCNIRQNDALKVVSFIIDKIRERLLAGGSVEFRDFGVFTVVTRKSSIGRNPKNPAKDILIPERKLIRFKTGRLFKKELAELAPAVETAKATPKKATPKKATRSNSATKAKSPAAAKRAKK